MDSTTYTSLAKRRRPTSDRRASVIRLRLLPMKGCRGRR